MRLDVNVKINGLKELKQELKKVTAKTKSAGVREMHRSGLDLQGKSQQIVPHDTGDLQGSAFTETDKDAFRTVIGYSSEYAVRQHENLKYSHKPGRQAKFLEQPYKENVDKYIENIRKAIAKDIE